MKLKFLSAALLAALTACGDASAPRATAASEDTIAGIVRTDEGPVTKGQIEAQDSKGAIVARTEIGGDSHYRLTLPANTAYPIILTAHPEGSAQALKAAVTSSLAEEQEISEVTTLVVDSALSLGGLTEANLAKAAGAAISQRRSTGGSGGSAGFKGDPTKQYGGWH